jgi:methionyl-tRNA synthetase
VCDAWLKQGLRDRCISRDLQWGFAVPDLANKVLYCWFDAPIGYLGATRSWAEANGEDWLAWWGAASDARITCFLGKDNLPFHTVLFPAVLLGAGGLKLPDQVVGSHWLNWYGKPFSTSDKRGIFLDTALELLPADVWRWALLAQAPESSDSRFSWDLLARNVNKDLVGGYGNFVQRVTRLAARHGDVVPSAGQPGPAEQALSARCEEVLARLGAALDGHHFRDAVGCCRALWREGNLYIDTQAPWRLVHEDPERAAVVLRTCFQVIALVAAAAAPLLPHTGQRVAEALHLEAGELSRPLDALTPLQGLGGRRFEVIAPLFARVDAEALEARFPAEGEQLEAVAS